jgi:hypothetical protein
MNWLMSAGNAVAGYATDAFSYVQNNEWAANAVAGAATAGAGYLMQKDQQDYDTRREDKAWNRKMDLTKAPTIDGGAYDWSNLSDGGLVGSGLITQANQ